MSDLRKRFSLDCLVSAKNNDDENMYNKGFNDCKRKVLEILQKDFQNCDLSTDSCDSRYIEKIKGL